jgi:ATP-dependent helicase HepA
VEPLPTFDLRLASLRHLHTLAQSPARGFAGARMDLIPHQLYIAHEVSRRALPRVLLADEVGLGKTIEACLILHRLLRSGQITRALIVVPDRWSISGSSSCCAASRSPSASTTRPAAGPSRRATRRPIHSSRNSWSVRYRPAGRETDARGPGRGGGLGLLIVDEAHHLEWTPEAPARPTSVVEALAQVTPRLLLLTATPEQLGLESHFARLRLLDPHRYPDFDRYVKEHAGYEAAARKARTLIRKGRRNRAAGAAGSARAGARDVPQYARRHAGFSQAHPAPVALAAAADERARRARRLAGRLSSEEPRRPRCW